METINQLSIFLENKKGRLNTALKLLSQENVNIRALLLADTSEFGILRLVVDKPKEGKKILEDGGFTVKYTPIIGVELEDQPGGLNKILNIIEKNNINLDYLYAFTHEKTDNAILFLYAENLENLSKILKENEIRIVSKDEIYNL